MAWRGKGSKPPPGGYQRLTDFDLMRIGYMARRCKAWLGTAGSGLARQGIETPQKTVESSWNSQPWTDEN